MNIKNLLSGIYAAFKPRVLDTDELIRNIHTRTGIDVELIKVVIDSEMDYMIETGIAYKVD